jgi:hypothetical protein
MLIYFKAPCCYAAFLYSGTRRSLSECKKADKIWLMKLRLDLLEHLKDEDILQEVLANNPRYKPEPLLSKTGTGGLLSASTEERAKEVERSMELTRKLEARARKSGKSADRSKSRSRRS